MEESTYNYMNRTDLDRVLAAIPTLKIRKWDDYDIQMLFKILYFCALRPIEGITLQKKNFRFANREIFLGKTKTSKADHAVIPLVFLDELKRYVNNKKEEQLFPGLNYYAFYHWLKRLGKQLGIQAWIEPQKDTGEKTVGHIFRKSIGKEMLSGTYGIKAKDISVISKQLRHKKPSITIDHYLNSSIEKVKDAW